MNGHEVLARRGEFQAKIADLVDEYVDAISPTALAAALLMDGDVDEAIEIDNFDARELIRSDWVLAVELTYGPAEGKTANTSWVSRVALPTLPLCHLFGILSAAADE